MRSCWPAGRQGVLTPEWFRLEEAKARKVRIVTYVFSIPGWTPVDTRNYKGTKVTNSQLNMNEPGGLNCLTTDGGAGVLVQLKQLRACINERVILVGDLAKPTMILMRYNRQ